MQRHEEGSQKTLPARTITGIDGLLRDDEGGRVGVPGSISQRRNRVSPSQASGTLGLPVENISDNNENLWVSSHRS